MIYNFDPLFGKFKENLRKLSIKEFTIEDCKKQTIHDIREAYNMFLDEWLDAGNSEESAQLLLRTIAGEMDATIDRVPASTVGYVSLYESCVEKINRKIDQFTRVRASDAFKKEPSERVGRPEGATPMKAGDYFDMQRNGVDPDNQGFSQQSNQSPTLNAENRLSTGKRILGGLRNGLKYSAAIGIGAMAINATPWLRNAGAIIMAGVGLGRAVKNGFNGREIGRENWGGRSSPGTVGSFSRSMVSSLIGGSPSTQHTPSPTQQINSATQSLRQEEQAKEDEDKNKEVVDLLEKIEENTRDDGSSSSNQENKPKSLLEKIRDMFSKFSLGIAGLLGSITKSIKGLASGAMKALSSVGIKGALRGAGMVGGLSLLASNPGAAEDDPVNTGLGVGMTAASVLPGPWGIAAGAALGGAAYVGSKIKKYQNEKQAENEKTLTESAGKGLSKDELDKISSFSDSGIFGKLKDTVSGNASEKGQLLSKIEKMIETQNHFTKEEVEVIKKKFGDSVNIPGHLIVDNEEQKIAKDKEGVDVEYVGNSSSAEDYAKLIKGGMKEDTAIQIINSQRKEKGMAPVSLSKEKTTIARNDLNASNVIKQERELSEADKDIIEKGKAAGLDASAISSTINMLRGVSSSNSSQISSDLLGDITPAAPLSMAPALLQTPVISQENKAVTEQLSSIQKTLESNNTSSNNTIINGKEQSIIPVNTHARTMDTTMLRYLDRRPVHV